MRHPEVEAWVQSIADLARPDSIHWCDGSEAERQYMLDMLVERGTLRRLDEDLRPNSYIALSDPKDVARVESRTYICTKERDDAGPTNNWCPPAAMRAELAGLFEGCMEGRTLYVVPYAMGPLDGPFTSIGVELTDSPYVVISMGTMTRMGGDILEALGSRPFVKGIHSVGAPLRTGESDVAWPCNDLKYIVHYPEDGEIWSFGSGYGGNALLGKKCHALRIASAIARREGWFAEHMLILKLTSPENETHYVAGAFPSACGKTNLAMIEPALKGWRAEMVGDDIAWLRFGPDGRLYAVNPEAGLFGVAPGTSAKTNSAALEALKRDTIFTNVARTATGDVWWEGLTASPPADLIDWRNAPWSPASGEPAAHPNARFTVSVEQCPKLAPEWSSPNGVPISAILFGGRRASVTPLVVEAESWEQGVFLASSMASEGTAAAENAVGVLRRDPFAMLPFCGYNIGDYLAHWLGAAGRVQNAKLPRIYLVNWFRRSRDGKFIWPGFGDNVRVLKWICDRLTGKVDGRQSPIGIIPGLDELDLDGMTHDATEIEAILAIDKSAWAQEADDIAQFYASLGDRMPARLLQEVFTLKARCEHSDDDEGTRCLANASKGQPA